MRLELTGRHIVITPALRRLVDRKLAKLDRLLNDSAVSAQAVLSRERHRHRADITLHTRGEKFLHGVGDTASWEASLGEAIEKITQQVQRVKGKWQERKRHGRTRDAAAEPAAAVATPSDSRGPSEAPKAIAVKPLRYTRSRERPRMPRVFRAAHQVVKAMSIVEAARQMDGNDDGLLVFRDVETETISVLYRRQNGELMLVHTEM